MKILMQNRSKESWIGGDYIQMEATANALREKGVEVIISDQEIFMPVGVYQSVDLVHLWNFSMAWTKPQMGLAILHKKPIVCSMIYHLTDKWVTWPEQKFMATYLDKGIFLCEGELKRFRKAVDFPDDKVSFIGNGITKDWFKEPKKGRYALTVGRISAFKGQLETAKACKQLKIPYHIIGEVEDDAYLMECVKYGAIYRGIMTKEEVQDEMSKASVVVVASKNELMSLVAMEAIASGKKLVMTDKSEWKPNTVYCKPGNVSSIKKAIKKALEEPVNIELIKEVGEMTWDKVADKLIKVYEEAIAKHSNSKQEPPQPIKRVYRKHKKTDL